MLYLAIFKVKIAEHLHKKFKLQVDLRYNHVDKRKQANCITAQKKLYTYTYIH